MSSFSIPPLSSGINFDISEFTKGMDSVAEGAARGGQSLSSGIQSGVMGAEATMQLFPAAAVELIQNPILGVVNIAVEALKALGEMVMEVADHFQQINLGSIKSGLDPAVFSSFSAAAKASGVEVASFTSGIELLQDRAANAARGDAQAVKGFEDLGISAKEVAGLLNDPKELLLRVADAMSSIETPGQRVQAAMESMGRGGKEMLPFLELGRKGITDMANDLGDLGARVDEQEAGQGKAWAGIKAQFEAAWEGIKTAVAEPILEFFSENVGDLHEGIKSFTESIKSGLTSAMQFLGPIMHSVWNYMKAIGDVIGTILMPLLEVLKPILFVIGETIRFIADALSEVTNLVGAGLHGIAGLFTGDFSGAQKNIEAMKDSARDMGRIFTGEEEVKVKHEVNVTVHSDPASIDQAAKKIGDHVAGKLNEHTAKAVADKSAQRVGRALRGH